MQFLEKIKLFNTLAESLGGVESLASIRYDGTRIDSEDKRRNS
jgi:cystathionine beta-lyase/cystathionine gamma-synthase